MFEIFWGSDGMREKREKNVGKKDRKTIQFLLQFAAFSISISKILSLNLAFNTFVSFS